MIDCRKYSLWRYLFLVIFIVVVTWMLQLYHTLGYGLSINDEQQVGKYDRVWLKVTPQLSVFSAYFDHRVEDDGYGEVKIMAFAKETYNKTMYCYFEYNNATVCLKRPGKRSFFRRYDDRPLADRPAHNPVMYSCVLSTTQVPNAVAITSDKRCGSSTRKPPRSLVIVSHEKWSPMKEFGVCVHSPLFNMNDYEFVAGFVETNRILGTKWFTFYVSSASHLVLKLLETYQADGLVDVVKNWGTNLPNARYYGQDLSVQDCLYRNMHKVKYLVYTDLDEHIFPMKHPSWHEMMKALDDGKTSAFYFPQIALFLNPKDPNITRLQNTYGWCSGPPLKLLQPPRILSFTLRSGKISKNKSKMMIKPLAIRALKIHRVLEFVDEMQTRSTFVDVMDVCMFHVRLPAVDKFRKRTVYYDKLQSLVPQLFSNLKTRLCHLK